ncbi:hypothetical protein CBS63078_10483 [Aspergillus niger]|nr:hypothetical protein CBS115989_428 [Aspergillus niger]KAI2832098.1 hypothetical protein CBS133816_1975 [Aspergillus niger]KAI2840696.1 hypothetical protein CBS11232_8989 [Aspergillus niger]KAI2870548.1 hypothetical protein CBS115988_9246 [Aspergillus niger]KAI2880986.1 hypothetical protein CBS11852_9857 [Aspergillus niger]
MGWDRENDFYTHHFCGRKYDEMANQCSGHVFVIVQATNGNILTWRCSDCNSGPLRGITSRMLFLPLDRLIRTFPGTSKKPSAALLAPYLPKAYQPFLCAI